ncbi:MAG TPA: glycosyltransferase family 39 protein [Vicinamibacteria bacterium]|nr:glycosyltransferase family 39 protein [Vicinamibacteria bacterium]
MPKTDAEDTRPPVAWAWVTAPLLALFAVHLAVLGRYGIGWDELYYVACADHLDWGYVDHPPFIAFVTALTRFLLGDSLPALRLPCLLAGLAAALLAGLIARELGAGRFGQLLATTCVALAPAALVIDHLLSMNAFDHLFWALAVLVVARILGRHEPRLWPVFGVVVGIGLLNKYSIGFLCAALGIGLLLTPARRHLANWRFWLGAVVAGLLFLPHVLWELHQGWPSLEFMHNVTARKNLPLSPWAFVSGSADQVNVFALPVWALGLGYLLFSRRGRRFRALGWIYPVLLVVFQASQGKPYYLVPAYFALFAAGALLLEGATSGRPWLRVPLAALILVPALVRSPLFLPLLKEPQLVAYQDWLGAQPKPDERGAVPTKLPSYFASQHGFEDLVQVVARIYRSLPAAERARTAIYASGYGNAAAVDYFGRSYALPRAISGHNSYWIWGPRDYTGATVIVIDATRRDLEQAFATVGPGETVDSPYAQHATTVFLCRGLRQPLRTLWPQVRTYH